MFPRYVFAPFLLVWAGCVVYAGRAAVLSVGEWQHDTRQKLAEQNLENPYFYQIMWQKKNEYYEEKQKRVEDQLLREAGELRKQYAELKPQS